MTEDKPFSISSLAERCEGHPFFIGMDLEIATIRRRNLLTVISGLSSEGCQVKDPEAAIAEFSALVAECDKEIARLKGMLELSA